MKKKIVVALLLSVGLLAAGCSGDTKATETAKATTEAASETKAPETKAQEDTTESKGTEKQSETASESETQAQTERVKYKALDYVTLGEYKGLEVTLEKQEVTDEEINEQAESTISQQNKLEEVKDGTVEDGDIVNIDYEGKVDGKVVDGAVNKGYELTIGSNTFITGFEEGLVGAKVGESKDLNLTFPEDYTAEELKGKPVVFHVTVNSIKRMPELTDQLVQEISEVKTVAEYKAQIKDTLMQQKAVEQQNKEISDLISKVNDGSKINDYPKELVDQNVQQMTDYYKSYAEQSDQTFEEFLQANMQMTEDEFMKKAEENVKQGLTQEMLLRAISEKENITVSDEEYSQGLTKYSQDYGFENEADFVKQYGKDVIEFSLVQDKVVLFLQQNAVVTNEEDRVVAESEKAADEKESETAQKESETQSESETKKAE